MAELAYRWAVVLSPTDPTARAGLIRALISAGNEAAAETAWSEMRRVLGDTGDTLALRQELDATQARGPR